MIEIPTNWLIDVINNLPRFLKLLESDSKPGYYKYSLSGDLYDESKNWGLGNAVFATKILYMINQLTPEKEKNLASFISSFQTNKGEFYDPIVMKNTKFLRFARTIKYIDFSHALNKYTIRAETRQAFASLFSINRIPTIPFKNIPNDKSSLKKYIHKLDWAKPWGASSHISHLIFFIYYNKVYYKINEEEASNLIKMIFLELEQYHQKDGSWYKSGFQIPTFQKVNSAMKIMTAYDIINKSVDNPEGLIDLCLKTINSGHACNHFNIIKVLYNCMSFTDYQRDETMEYCNRRLDMYKKHYWPEYGGFSFEEREANQFYYGAKITKGITEPDIHGTVMFLWGIVLISKILRIKELKGLKMPIT